MNNRSIGFSDSQKMRFQERLVKYIVNYENKSSRSKMRSYLGVSNERYSDYRSLKKPHGRFINSLEYLDKLANITGLEIWEFVRWVEGKKSRTNELGEIESLRPWEDSILSAFDLLDLNLRKNLVEMCRESRRKPERFHRIINMILNLYYLDEDLEVAEAFLKAVLVAGTKEPK